MEKDLLWMNKRRYLKSVSLWLKCNRPLRLGRPVGAVTLSRWEWWWNERWIWGARGGVLNLISTNYPDQVTMGVFPFQGKTHMVEPGIEPGTSWLVFRSFDIYIHTYIYIYIYTYIYIYINKIYIYMCVCVCVCARECVYLNFNGLFSDTSDNSEHTSPNSIMISK